MGARALATPAFALAGPRHSSAPFDLFEANGEIARYWGFGNSFGTLPFDHVGDKLGRQRDARGDEAFPTSGWIYTLEPTLKLKPGPIVAFDAWTIDHFQFPDAPSALTFRASGDAGDSLELAFPSTNGEEGPGCANPSDGDE